jgi:hypothetical protein
MLFLFAFIFQTGKMYLSFGCFVKDLKPYFNLCLKLISAQNCAKLLVSLLQVGNCVSKLLIKLVFFSTVTLNHWKWNMSSSKQSTNSGAGRSYEVLHS